MQILDVLLFAHFCLFSEALVPELELSQGSRAPGLQSSGARRRSQRPGVWHVRCRHQKRAFPYRRQHGLFLRLGCRVGPAHAPAPPGRHQAPAPDTRPAPPHPTRAPGARKATCTGPGWAPALGSPARCWGAPGTSRSLLPRHKPSTPRWSPPRRRPITPALSPGARTLYICGEPGASEILCTPPRRKKVGERTDGAQETRPKPHFPQTSAQRLKATSQPFRVFRPQKMSVTFSPAQIVSAPWDLRG
ncbi:uncharacterized protein LOC129044731 [Pongo pygmaeus]|uniref:uncharacterized protein LOC129044731 n=1 Tax=Pongo pygmaeus TaxID=9600 RepID=UPI0023E1C513|nr:uncharacterized protein LOC129044731 [Pongo pygmaeus]